MNKNTYQMGSHWSNEQFWSKTEKATIFAQKPKVAFATLALGEQSITIV